MTGFFITGTDTGVGKTTVTAALARILRAQGRKVSVCKPVATGARQVGDQWLSEDTLVLAQAAGLKPAQVTRWAFPEEVAPPVAARLHGVTLTLADLKDAVLEHSRLDTIVLVEGVGGLLCPLTDRETVADLAAALALPLVVVARRSLGTLNHTLLTLEVARGRGLSVAGVIVNQTTPDEDLAGESNVAELRRRDVPVLAVLPFLAEPCEVPEELADVDWRQLMCSPLARR